MGITVNIVTLLLSDSVIGSKLPEATCVRAMVGRCGQISIFSYFPSFFSNIFSSVSSSEPWNPCGSCIGLRSGSAFRVDRAVLLFRLGENSCLAMPCHALPKVSSMSNALPGILLVSTLVLAALKAFLVSVWPNLPKTGCKCNWGLPEC